ncbi:MAG: DUF3109 family protein [Saprospiraceae bacterium]|nr:DUF3109 family protein [Saprospiraceae bacterium]
MLLIEEVLLSEDLFLQQFTCNLNACKGACCWEGDWGAPLEDDEIETLKEIREQLRPFLTAAGNELIDKVGSHVFYDENQTNGTPLIQGAACAYLTYDENGTGRCGIEKAYQAGVSDFIKPISCHLYPVRYTKIEHVDFEALNYERWEICQAACALGESLKMPVFRFVKDALIRKFGNSFYEELEKVANDYLLDKRTIVDPPNP